jgi:uncharacterized protein (TIGR00369 family)
MSEEPQDRPDIRRLLEEQAPFNRLLGIKADHVEAGRAVASLAIRPDFVGDPRRPALHGGVICSLVDTAGGAAAWSTISAGESLSTVDLRVDFLEPARLAGPLRAEASTRRRGSRVCHVRVTVTQEDVLVAEASLVYRIHGARTDP